jgi:phenylpropionate dioxygenase-like ring-hydroxylating dioxygenase large terminal subunit
MTPAQEKTTPDGRAPWLVNCWYQAAWSHELAVAPLLTRRILDREILLFRDPSGAVCGVDDRCPHRFAPLSAGTLKDGTIHCGYHGLGFNGQGRCVVNPHGAIPAAMRVRSYRVLERHQAVWIWMGAGVPDEKRLPALDFIDQTPDTAKFFGYMDTAVNYQLLTDNILDLSHADFLHPNSLGGIMIGAKTTMRQENSAYIIRWLSDDCPPPPAYLSLVPPPSRADIWTEVRWQPPALMILGTGANPTGAPREPSKEATTLHNMTPASPTRTHYFYCSTRKFKVHDAAFNQMLGGLITGAFENEDKPMLEKQQRAIGTLDFGSMRPVLLNIDIGSVKVRRLLTDMIDAEHSAMPNGPSSVPPARTHDGRGGHP